MPPINPKPSRADALAALELLKAAVGTFPFVGRAHKAAWVAMVLTAVVRRNLPTAPLFAISARFRGAVRESWPRSRA